MDGSLVLFSKFLKIANKSWFFFQPDLVKSYGYPFEEHFIETEDGYKLTLHRIPGVQRKNQTNKRHMDQLIIP